MRTNLAQNSKTKSDDVTETSHRTLHGRRVHKNGSSRGWCSWRSIRVRVLIPDARFGQIVDEFEDEFALVVTSLDTAW